MAVQYLGYILIGLGIVIILLALIIGYGVYIDASSSLNNVALVNPSGGGTLNSSISNLTDGLRGTAAVGTYTAIEIAVLFLIASIGYKIAYLGIQVNNGSKATDKQAKMK